MYKQDARSNLTWMSDHRIDAFGVGRVGRRIEAILWHLAALHQAGEITAEVQAFKLSAAEAVDQRVQQAVEVGQNHEAVEGLCGDVLCVLRPPLHPGDEQNHPCQGAGQEADGEHHHDGGDQERRPPQLGLVPHRLLPQPVDDADSAVEKDDEGDDDLGEEHYLTEAVHHILPKMKRFMLPTCSVHVSQWHMHACTHAHIHKYTHMHTCTHTHIHI